MSAIVRMHTDLPDAESRMQDLLLNAAVMFSNLTVHYSLNGRESRSYSS
jgi:hypothetical protein